MQNPQAAASADLKKSVVLACQRLYQRGLVANHDGNISVRLPDGGFLATPTSFSKGDVTADDLLVLDSAGKVIQGKHKVFSEISWHLAIYRARPDVSCVVHAHPTVAAGFALAGKEIGTPALPEAVVSLGRHILNTKFISPLDPSLSKAGGEADLEFRRALNESDACLVPGNGAWTVGSEVMQTYYRMELVEHIAEQHRNALALGALRGLPSALVEDLLKKRPARVPTAAVGAPTPSSACEPIKPAIDRDELARIVRDELSQIIKQG